MARILTIFGPFEPHRRQLQFPKISNERKIIESIESIDSIERSRDRSDRSTAAMQIRGRIRDQDRDRASEGSQAGPNASDWVQTRLKILYDFHI